MSDRNFFYTAEPNYKSVSYIELCEFIEDYPRALKVHNVKFPQGNYKVFYDDAICDRFGYNKVASINREGDETRCVIIDNYEELFKTKTVKTDKDARELAKENLKKYREAGLVLSEESELERRFLEI